MKIANNGISLFSCGGIFNDLLILDKDRFVHISIIINQIDICHVLQYRNIQNKMVEVSNCATKFLKLGEDHKQYNGSF